MSAATDQGALSHRQGLRPPPPLRRRRPSADACSPPHLPRARPPACCVPCRSARTSCRCATTALRSTTTMWDPSRCAWKLLRCSAGTPSGRTLVRLPPLAWPGLHLAPAAHPACFPLAVPALAATCAVSARTHALLPAHPRPAACCSPTTRCRCVGSCIISRQAFRGWLLPAAVDRCCSTRWPAALAH